MRIITVCFDYPGTEKFKTLCKVFEMSCKVNSAIPQETFLIKPPQVSRKKSYHSNTDKLDIWNEVVQSSNEDLILMDCDMLLRHDITCGFDSVVDIGYTYADYERKLPFNGGVMFVKNTKKAKEIMNRWTQINRKMIDDSQFHLVYKQKYAGINQASWGYLLEQGIDADRLPMSVYNLCDMWPVSDAKVVHYKSRLRKAVFNELPENRFAYWVKEWEKYKSLLTL